ncbi:MAG TPA: hypothetical protein PK224_19050, partial [Nitrospira sp.]|nr:hypothetical protein [Nitrospira sp.]
APTKQSLLDPEFQMCAGIFNTSSEVFSRLLDPESRDQAEYRANQYQDERCLFFFVRADSS